MLHALLTLPGLEYTIWPVVHTTLVDKDLQTMPVDEVLSCFASHCRSCRFFFNPDRGAVPAHAPVMSHHGSAFTQAEQLVESGEAVFVDVRPSHEYEQQHLPGGSKLRAVSPCKPFTCALQDFDGQVVLETSVPVIILQGSTSSNRNSCRRCQPATVQGSRDARLLLEREAVCDGDRLCHDRDRHVYRADPDMPHVMSLTLSLRERICMPCRAEPRLCSRCTRSPVSWWLQGEEADCILRHGRHAQGAV